MVGHGKLMNDPAQTMVRGENGLTGTPTQTPLTNAERI